jgi:hypothetical protein
MQLVCDINVLAAVIPKLCAAAGNRLPKCCVQRPSCIPAGNSVVCTFLVSHSVSLVAGQVASEIESVYNPIVNRQYASDGFGIG